MLRRRSRVLAGLAATAVIAGFAVGCGGDDSSEAQATTTVVVTEAPPTDVQVAPIPDPATTESADPVVTESPGGSGIPGGDAQAREMVIRMYTEQFGFTEDQASCLYDKVIELGGENADMSSIMSQGGMQILNDCNISISDLTRIGEQMGGAG